MNNVSLTLVHVTDYLEGKGIFVKPQESINSGTQIVTEQKFSGYDDTGLRLLISDLADSLGCASNAYEINGNGENCHIDLPPTDGTAIDDTDTLYFYLLDENDSQSWTGNLAFSMKG